MELPILQTKLYIPKIRPALVSRPRLVEHLSVGLHRKLALISAPAGFGKTTLISAWVAEDERPTAWLSLDENDNDPVRFLTYLIRALQTVKAEVGARALSALRSPQPPPVEGVLTSLINEMAGTSERMVLVLDDYHLVEAEPIHDALTFLLQNLPQQMHLVIATRVDPPLPLARLRARGQLTELRAGDLRFTPAETAEFLNRVMGLDLAESDIAALESRTEGWIAGLQLAAVSMQGREDVRDFIASFTGSHHFILDYLVEEVLHRQPELIQTFLLQTSILERLAGPLCDAVTGQDDGQRTLEALQHANLFIIPLDDERRWYRYHHLFADLLRQRLHRTQPALVKTLHVRASAWYEDHGFVTEAIDYAMHAEAAERAISLIAAHADAFWRRAEHAKLARWLYELPSNLVITMPHLCIFSAWYLYANGQRDKAAQALQIAERTLDAEATSPEPGQRAGPDRQTLRGRLAAIRALMETWGGDGTKTIAYARQALECLPKQDPWYGPAAIALGDGYYFQGDMAAAYRAQLDAAEACRAAGDLLFSLIAHLKQTFTLKTQGRLPQALAICREQIRFADECALSQTSIVGGLWAMWGEVLAEFGDLEGAIPRVRKGAALAEGGGDLALLGFSYLSLMKVLSYAGDTAGVDEVFLKLQHLAQQHDLPPIVAGPLSAWQGARWLLQGDLEAAAQWAAEQKLDVDSETPFLRRDEYALFARLLIAQGRLEEAAELLARLIKAAEARGYTSELLEYLILQSRAFQPGEDKSQAMTSLERALALAKPGDFVHIFVNEGPPMAHLLREALKRGIAPEYVQRLLAAFPDAGPEPVASQATAAANADLIEPLSERELEVLQLLAEGLTNREIASRLYLSLNTIKVHTRNIYGKLGVNNRTQATHRAQVLGLL